MAVEKIPQQASKFWPVFFKQTMTLVVLAQILISLAVGAVLVLFEVFTINSIELWAIVVGLLAVNLAISIPIFISAVRPTRDLLAAIIHASGEQSALTLPNPNTERNEQTGFRDAL